MKLLLAFILLFVISGILSGVFFRVGHYVVRVTKGSFILIWGISIITGLLAMALAFLFTT